MAFSNPTTHYGLPNWVATDIPSYLTDFNEAFTKIDNQMFANGSSVGAAVTAANQAVTAAEAATTAAEAATTAATTAGAKADTATATATTANNNATAAVNTAGNASQTATAAQQAVDGLEVLVEAAQNDIIGLEQTAIPTQTTLTLSSASWTGDAENGWQYVISATTDSRDKYDITPTATEVKYFTANGIACVIGNTDNGTGDNVGTATLYAFGDETAVKAMPSITYSFERVK